MKRSSRLAMLAAAAAALAFASPAAAQEPPQAVAEKAEGRLFAILLEPGPAWKPGRPFREQGLLEHFHYWMQLFREGRIVTAGPLGDDGGLVLLRAADQAEADAILAADPAITAGIFTGTVRPYAPPMVNPVPLGTAAEARKRD